MKGYELLKLIAENKIKEGTRFKDNYNTYIYEYDTCGCDLTIYNISNKDIPDYSYFADNSNEFEIIEEDKEIEPLNAYKLMESPYMADLLRQQRYDEFMEHIKQSEVEIVNKIAELVNEVNKLKENNK